jgi:hypothetical protein
MRKRHVTVTWRADDSEEVLQPVYLAQRDGVNRTWLQAFWLLRSERSLGVTTTTLGAHCRTGQPWIEWYRRGGLALVRSRRMGGVGRAPFLAREEQLAQVASTGRFRMAP